MSVNIARCPEHGLHGERKECFVCGGPVEQVPMVPAAERDRYRAAIDDALAWLDDEAGPPMPMVAETILRAAIGAKERPHV